MDTGYITYYNNKKRYGFIDCPQINTEGIFFHRTNCNKDYKNIFIGDKVKLEIKKENDTYFEGFNIDFEKNASLEFFEKDFLEGKIKNGFLKKIDDNFYVKDLETYIYIKLILSPYEDKIFENYENRIDTLVDYRIIVFSERNKIKAIIPNRSFIKEFENSINSSNCVGTIEKVVKGGFQIRVFEKILAFIPYSLVSIKYNNLNVGDSINVKCINYKEDSTNLVFDLA